MPEMRTARLEACWRLISRYESEGNDFLFSIVIEEKSWVHHYDSELKSQSLEYCHPTHSGKKNSKTQPSAGKCMLTVFWDYTGIIHHSTWPKV
jgi:hypothetical protein